MTNMRKLIAKHMIESRRTSAHVHCMYEVDFTRIVNLRNKQKTGFEQRHGARLTFMPFFVRAAVIALQQWPIITASIEGDNIRYHRQINMGIAVALDWGLIVPVIKNASDLSLSGLTRSLNDLADRARTKRLKPEDVQGATFTITNPGVFGSLLGTPIIPLGTSAILGLGAIEKRPKVLTGADGEDVIAVRTCAYFSLSFDHRIVDGADADKFLASIKKGLETFPDASR
jgi:2-oxoglutarate dehydrogenase E2 component (dihydrolipoamide succinyltransferase)